MELLLLLYESAAAIVALLFGVSLVCFDESFEFCCSIGVSFSEFTFF